MMVKWPKTARGWKALLPMPNLTSSGEPTERGTLLISDAGGGEAELTLDVVLPWPEVLAIMQTLDPGSRSSESKT